MKRYAVAGASGRALTMFVEPIVRTFADSSKVAGVFDINLARCELVRKMAMHCEGGKLEAEEFRSGPQSQQTMEPIRVYDRTGQMAVRHVPKRPGIVARDFGIGAYTRKGHKGGDVRILQALFQGLPEDPYNLMADSRAGPSRPSAASLPIGPSNGKGLSVSRTWSRHDSSRPPRRQPARELLGDVEQGCGVAPQNLGADHRKKAKSSRRMSLPQLSR